MAKRKYRKLGGKAGNLAGYYSLWRAEDHILSCQENHFFERYKRYYYKDIQGLTALKTPKSLIINITTAIFLLVALVGIIKSADAGWSIFWWIIFGMVLPIFVINWIKGQSCLTYIKTAVQNEKLPTINRVKRFDRFLKIVRPLIEAAQGQVDVQTLSTQYDGMEVKAIAPKGKRIVEDQGPEQDSLEHTILFSLFIVFALLSGMDYYLNNVFLDVFNLILMFGVVVLNIVAIVKQQHLNLRKAIKNWTVFSLVYLGILFFIYYIVMIAMSVDLSSHGEFPESYTPLDTLRYYSNFGPEDNIGLKVASIFTIYSSLFVGFLGLVWSAKPRQKNNTSSV